MALVEMDFASGMGSNIIPDYSAADDIVDILSNGNVIYTIGTNHQGLGYLDVSEIDGGTYTFRSKIAKNPSSLSSLYTKEIDISSCKEIKVMPDGNVLYWYGYKDDNLEEMSTAYGWEIWSGNAYKAPTFNTQNIYMGGNAGYWGGVGSKNSISNATTLHAVAICTTTSYKGIWIHAATTKAINASDRVGVDIVNGVANQTKYATCNVSSFSNPIYIDVDSGSDRYGYLYAFWYE